MFVVRLIRHSADRACIVRVLQDPKAYVQTVLDVHKKYNALVVTAFNRDAGFVAALDKVSLAPALFRFHSGFPEGKAEYLCGDSQLDYKINKSLVIMSFLPYKFECWLSWFALSFVALSCLNKNT